jgi:hypothetical protein
VQVVTIQTEETAGEEENGITVEVAIGGGP